MGLAQLILHELCHALVEGPGALNRPDWGLDNESARDVEREHACLRLQARLAQRQRLESPYGAVKPSSCLNTTISPL